MKLFRSASAVIALTMALGACANPPTPTTTPTSGTTTPQVTVTTAGSLATLVSSSAGQSLIANLVNEAFPALNQIVAKGAAATAADLQIVSYWLPWLQAAVNLFGPTVMTPAQVAAVSQAITQLQALVAAPPSSTATLVAQVGQLVGDIQTDLAPATSAAAKPAS